MSVAVVVGGCGGGVLSFFLSSSHLVYLFVHLFVLCFERICSVVADNNFGFRRVEKKGFLDFFSIQ